MNPSYKQPVKEVARATLWKHAVESLTIQRNESQILNEKYIQRLWDYCFEERIYKYTSVKSIDERFLDDWFVFSKQCYGSKKPDELKVAYLCGPEPENDLEIMLNLGLRIENIWAFESDNKSFKTAIKSIKESYPTLKIFNGKIDTYLSIAPTKYDIIYLDFTGPIFSHSTKPYIAMHSVFDTQALNELGVLVVNSCFPDKTDETVDFLSTYFFNQKLIESTVLSDDPESMHDGSYGEGAGAYGFVDKKQIRSLIDKNFWYAYSAFATHYPLFYANLIQPAFHVLKNPLAKKRLFQTDKSKLEQIEQRYLGREEIVEEWTEFSFLNFLYELSSGKIADAWGNHFNKELNQTSLSTAVKYLYMLRDAAYGGFMDLLSDSLKESIPKINRNIPDTKGGLFCDVPMIHLWFELAVNQLGYPYHSNIKNHKRFSYQAKEREMCVDIFSFDRCRALYDWLPMVEYYGEDLSNLERQMITRICMDAIGKHRLLILDSLYFGSSLVCINDKSWSENHALQERSKLIEK